MPRGFGVLVGSAAALFIAFMPKALAQVELVNGFVTSSALGPHSPRDESGYYGCYIVTLEGGATYSLRMRSEAFDTFVELTPDRACQGDALVHDDDGGEGTNSLLVFIAPSSGVFGVRARGFMRDAEGQYDIALGQGTKWGDPRVREAEDTDDYCLLFSCDGASEPEAPSQTEVEVCNDSGIAVMVAVSSVDVGDTRFRDHGWYSVPVAGCRVVATTDNAFFYLYAEATGGHAWRWEGSHGQCVIYPGPYSQYSARSSQCGPGMTWRGFHRHEQTNFGRFTWRLGPG